MPKKKAKTVLLILMLLSLGFMTFSGMPELKEVKAWGSPTHVFITNYAIEAMPPEWKPVFRHYIVELIRGSVAPDIISGMTGNFSDHLYYPETGKYTAPWGTKEMLEQAIANFTMGNWSAGMYALGYASHFFEDIHIPVHTDEYWHGHDAYEKDINAHLINITVTPITPTETIDDIVAYTISAAEYAHQFYDEIHEQYPDSEARVLDENHTLLMLTQDLLNWTVNDVAKFFYTAVQNFTPPTLTVTEEFDINILVDLGHDNDYSNGYLSALFGYLHSLGATVKNNTDVLTASDLENMDLLILTAPYKTLTTTEINVIKTWAESGNKSVLVTSRGDYNHALRGDLNNLLEALGVHIRINDDNVYEADPSAYKPWYVDITSVLPPELTKNITNGVHQIRFFSPSSLYLTDPSYVTVIAYGDPTVYQSDEDPTTPIHTIYDTTDDMLGGESIVLAAVEQVSTLRVAVFGTTIFSDFDFSNIFANNPELLKNLLTWFVQNRTATDDVTAPDVSITSPTAKVVSTSPLTIEWSTSATDVSAFYIAVNGEIKASTSDDTHSATVSISKGINFVRVFAVDGAGNVGAVNKTIIYDTESPTIMVLSPENNAEVSGAFTLSWNGTDDVGIDHYVVYVDGEEYATVTNTSITLNLSPGEHTIKITAFDIAGNNATAIITVTVSGGAVFDFSNIQIYIVAGVIAVVVIIAVIFFIKKKPTA